VPNEKMQPIQWTERPTGALVAASSLWPCYSKIYLFMFKNMFCKNYMFACTKAMENVKNANIQLKYYSRNKLLIIIVTIFNFVMLLHWPSSTQRKVFKSFYVVVICWKTYGNKVIFFSESGARATTSPFAPC
jgi:hypothetical protein